MKLVIYYNYTKHLSNNSINTNCLIKRWDTPGFCFSYYFTQFLHVVQRNQSQHFIFQPITIHYTDHVIYTHQSEQNQ